MWTVPRRDASDGRIDSRTLAEATAMLHARTARIVAWGSGSVFDYFHGLYPSRLEYVVDNDPARWGTRRHGVEIHPPDRLITEDERSTLVIIYSSAWPDIQQQLRTLGRFTSLPASAVFADSGTRERLAWAEDVAAKVNRLRVPSSKDAIVVQGPVLPGTTSQVLRVTAALHPRDRIVLSTWADTDVDLLEDAAALAHDVVLTPRPSHGGIQNRNYQIVSTQAGVARATDLGASTILKTRSDMAVLAPNVFDQARWWLGHLGSDSARAVGLRDRLLVPASFTRKFLLFHPSDMVMLGTAEDMARYWSVPLDPRSGDLLSPEWITRPLSTVNMEGNPSESYLGLELCRTLGRPAEATLRDSWAFYRDLFAVVDNEWFDLLWLKNLAIPDAVLRRGVRQTVSQQFWQRLHARDQDLEREMLEVDPHGVALGALAGAA